MTDSAQKVDASGGKLPVLTLKPGEEPPIGIRIYADGIRPDKPQNMLVRLIAQLTLALYTGMNTLQFVLEQPICISSQYTP